MVGRATITTASKPKILIGITYKNSISADKRDRIEQYYFMHAWDKFEYEVEYIWSKVWSSRKYNQIRDISDKRFDY